MANEPQAQEYQLDPKTRVYCLMSHGNLLRDGGGVVRAYVNVDNATKKARELAYQSTSSVSVVCFSPVIMNPKRKPDKIAYCLVGDNGEIAKTHKSVVKIWESDKRIPEHYIRRDRFAIRQLYGYCLPAGLTAAPDLL